MNLHNGQFNPPTTANFYTHPIPLGSTALYTILPGANLPLITYEISDVYLIYILYANAHKIVIYIVSEDLSCTGIWDQR